jgi:hypothetical protein
MQIPRTTLIGHSKNTHTHITFGLATHFHFFCMLFPLIIASMTFFVLLDIKSIFIACLEIPFLVFIPTGLKNYGKFFCGFNQ